MATKSYKEFDQCPICGDLFISRKTSKKIKCECCEFSPTKTFTLPGEDINRLDIAQKALSEYDFRKAERIYDLIIKDNDEESNSYLIALFGKLLAYFGVNYIKDFKGKTIPTFSRFNPDIKSLKDTKIYTRIVNLISYDKYIFLKMIDHLDSYYKNIVTDIDKNDIYDFFICTKNSLSNPELEELSADNTYACDLYNRLTSKGYNVFYSGKCNEEVEYDTNSLSPLLRSKRIVIVSTKRDCLESSWVSNILRFWTNLVDCGVKEKESLVLYLPKFDSHNFDLPKELSNTQSYTSKTKMNNAIDEFTYKSIEEEKKLDEEKKRLAQVTEANVNDSLGLIDTTYNLSSESYGIKEFTPKDENKKDAKKTEIKKANTALMLCIFLGIFGGHKFYQEKIWMGFLYYMTAGLFLVGWIYDIIDLNKKVKDLVNESSVDSKLKQEYIEANKIVNLCIFLGMFGIHRFAQKKFFSGLIYLFTVGLIYYGWIIDIIYYSIKRSNILKKF